MLHQSGGSDQQRKRALSDAFGSLGKLQSSMLMTLLQLVPQMKCSQTPEIAQIKPLAREEK